MILTFSSDTLSKNINRLVIVTKTLSCLWSRNGMFTDFLLMFLFGKIRQEALMIHTN